MSSLVKEPVASRATLGGFMQTSRLVGSSVLLATLLSSASVASAQQPEQAQAIRQEIDQLKKDFDARLSALESRLATLEGGQTAPSPSTAPAAQAGAPATVEVPSGAQGAGGPG